ncbi:hypothetical protein PULV_a2784 [Pseudoalteromonas ulvae UL12]|nr:hypothetical protein [Pseudoalteromonas ulvae UL12]
MSPERGQRQPLFGCCRQRDNNANLKIRFVKIKARVDLTTINALLLLSG